jgi:hypothetical protein
MYYDNFQAIRENWNLKYSATYVLCLLRDTGVKPQETVGASISVVSATSPGRPPTNLLTVLDTEPKTGIEVIYIHTYIQSYYSRFIHEGVAEASQTYL